MKKLTGSLPAKTAAVILSFILAAITACCAAAGVFMYYERFYTKTPEQIKEEKYYDILNKTACRIIGYYGSGDIEALKDLSYVYYTLTDGKTGETIIDTFEGQEYIGKAVYNNMDIYKTAEDTDGVYSEEYAGYVDITVYAADNYPLSYTSLLFFKATDFLYPLRYSIIPISLLALLAFVSVAVFIYAAAGRQADGSVKLSFFDKLPFCGKTS